VMNDSNVAVSCRATTVILECGAPSPL